MRFLSRLIGQQRAQKSFEPFANALADYGFEHCSQREGTLLVGLPPVQGLDSVGILDRDIRSIAFLAAPIQSDLIAAFARDPISQQIEELTVGTSHDYAQRRLGGFDFRLAIAALSRPMPALRKLSFGDMLQLFNGGQYYGQLGDIGLIFANCPNLEDLSLFGQFELGEPVTHSVLKSIYAAADSIGVSGGPVSHETVDRLLLSMFPVLETLTLELEEEDLQAPYRLPEGFETSNGMPRLRHLHLDPLTDMSLATLLTWQKTVTAL